MAKTELTDKSPMLIGKHKGEAMVDVPAAYLLWLGANIEKNKKAGNHISNNNMLILAYYLDNKEVLQKEIGQK